MKGNKVCFWAGLGQVGEILVTLLPQSWCQTTEKRKKEKTYPKEIEENNRMGKTRVLFKKIWDIKGIFHAKMDAIVFAYLAAYDSSSHNFILETWPSCDTTFLILPLISWPCTGFICRLTSALSLKAGSILGLLLSKLSHPSLCFNLNMLSHSAGYGYVQVSKNLTRVASKVWDYFFSYNRRSRLMSY